ncbi:MAG: SURF1 family protein [Pseudomonadales bacterium]|nr:SURF1 family protein [Pseudomonadales bacterium]
MTYKFSLGLTSFCSVLIAAFIALGYWQVSRAEQKSALQHAYDSAGQKPVVEITDLTGDLGAILYHRVRLVGHLEAQHQILLDNQTHDTTAGYHVLTPIKLLNGERHVMVNRGWVRGTGDRKILPPVETPKQQVVITGIVVPFPSRSPLISADIKPDIENPLAWFYFDTEYYQQQKNIAVGNHWINQQPDTKHGFIREWNLYNAKVGMHIGYAIMWFSFAVIMFVIYLSISVTRKPKVVIID